MLEAVCPNGHRLQVPLEHAGMKLRCPAPGCGAIFQLSATSPTGATVPLGAGGATAAPQPSPVQPTAAAPSPGVPAPPPSAAPQPGGYGVQQPAPPPNASQVASQPLSDAAGSRWTGTDQPPPQHQPAPPPAPQTSLSQSGPIMRSPGMGASRLPLTGSWAVWTHGLLMIGLTLVLTARGCDGLGARNVARLRAKVDQEQQVFENTYKLEVAEVNAELSAEKISDKQRLDLQKRLDDMRKVHDAETRDNEFAWSRMRNAAVEAQASNIVWGYWREMLFVAGTILFSLGLMALALGGAGAERYLAFGMLAIIVFSIYVGGIAWFTSIAGTMSGLNIR